MDFQSALEYLERSTQFDAVFYFELILDEPEDLDRLADAAEAIGWLPEINEERISVRVFRPIPRRRDLN